MSELKGNVRAPGKCSYFLRNKNRYCKFDVKPGFDLCGIHLSTCLPLADSGQTDTRLECPGCGTRYSQQKDLDVHTGKCPVLLQLNNIQPVPSVCVVDSNACVQASPWHSATCNAVSTTDADLPEVSNGPSSATEAATITARRIRAATQMGPAGFLSFVQRVEDAHAAVVATREEVVHEECPEECKEFMRPDIHRPFSAKHGLQQASILANMKDFGLLQECESRVFIEFGAGKGYLSGMLADAFKVSHLVLVDNQSFRKKADRGLRTVSMRRVRLDILDFDPLGLPDCTDWVALEGQGLAVATCCHHRCTWRHYVGKPFFTRLGFSPTEFEVMAWMSAWAVCGHERPAANPLEPDQDAELDGDETPYVRSEEPDQDTQRRGAQPSQEPDQDTPQRGTRPSQEPDQDSQRRGARPSQEPDQDSQQRGTGPSLEPDQETQRCGATPSQEPDQDTQRRGADPPPADRHELSNGPGEVCGSGKRVETQGIGVQRPAGIGLQPGALLPRARRIRVGLMCKQLIDAGRLDWLSCQGLQAEARLYVSPSVCGENRLLLARPPLPAQ